MPASYPGSAKSFTSRNAGDTIQPAHMNDVQDEINAIETGLLSGTAPLTSSNASVNNLSVGGTSTFAGAATFAGAVTLNGGLQSSNSTFSGTVLANGLVTCSSGLSVSSGGTATVKGPMVWSGSQTVTPSTGNNDNFAISSGVFFVRVSAPAGGSTLTGLSAGQVHGRTLFVTNVSGNSFDFSNAGVGSLSANRIATAGGANMTVATGHGVVLVYDTDGGGSFWRVVSL